MSPQLDDVCVVKWVNRRAETSTKNTLLLLSRDLHVSHCLLSHCRYSVWWLMIWLVASVLCRSSSGCRVYWHWDNIKHRNSYLSRSNRFIWCFFVTVFLKSSCTIHSKHSGQFALATFFSIQFHWVFQTSIIQSSFYFISLLGLEILATASNVCQVHFVCLHFHIQFYLPEHLTGYEIALHSVFDRLTICCFCRLTLVISRFLSPFSFRTWHQRRRKVSLRNGHTS